MPQNVAATDGLCSDDDAVAETLAVRGHQLAAVRDDKVAQWIHAEKHLQPWMGHAGLLVDRYDARLLLENEAEIRKLKAFALQTSPDEDGELRQQLDAERYRDLNQVDGRTKANQTKASSEPISSGAAVGFTYSTSLAHGQPPEQGREVMRRTASFVCSQSDGISRAIDVLKFKNIHNRSDPGSHLHPVSMSALLCVAVMSMCLLNLARSSLLAAHSTFCCTITRITAFSGRM